MPYNRILLTSVCVCGFAAASMAGPVMLNVRPGLWQMTSGGEMHGAPPIPADVLTRLPPAQHAKMQAVIAATMAHASKPHIYKSCVTDKNPRRGFDPSEHRSGEQCKSTILSSSASMMDVCVECVGERGGEHTSGHFSAQPGRHERHHHSAHTMRVKRVMHGQWLSADCAKYVHNDH